MSSSTSISEDSVKRSPSTRTFDAHFEKHRPRLRHVVRARMHPLLLRRIDSEDVIHEIFLAARQRIKQWKQGIQVPFYVWLRLIAVQTIQNLHRFHLQAKRRTLFQERHFESSHSSPGPAILDQRGTATSPSQAAMRREALTALEMALQQLSDDDREIISLRSFENLSNFEVAECLGLTGKAASIRYVRALQRLRNLLNLETEESKGH